MRAPVSYHSTAEDATEHDGNIPGIASAPQSDIYPLVVVSSAYDTGDPPEWASAYISSRSSEGRISRWSHFPRFTPGTPLERHGYCSTQQPSATDPIYITTCHHSIPKNCREHKLLNIISKKAFHNMFEAVTEFLKPKAAIKTQHYAHLKNNTHGTWYKDAGLRKNVWHCVGFYFAVFYLGVCLDNRPSW
jgi:hypothetical protein